MPAGRFLQKVRLQMLCADSPPDIYKSKNAKVDQKGRGLHQVTYLDNFCTPYYIYKFTSSACVQLLGEKFHTVGPLARLKTTELSKLSYY